MRVVLRPRAQVEEAWREWEKEARSRQDSARPSVVMATDAAALLDRRELVFHGRPYNVPAVPFPLAALILDVQERMRLHAASSKPAPDEVIATFARAIDLIRAGVRPQGLLRRLLWPLTPNPFRRATPREVGELLGFFCAFLALDGSASPPSASQPGTSRPRSPASPRRSRPGSPRTATRSPGVTS